MNSLNIDFRGGYLRILAVREGSVRYSKLVQDFTIADFKSAIVKLLSEIKRAGGKKGRVNLILPADIVRYKVFQVPAMDIGDAKKFIRKELSKELTGQKIVLGVRRLFKNKVGKQDILAEYVPASDVVRYLDLLKGCGIMPYIVTTSLEGCVKLFNKAHPETDGNEAVIEIDMNYIEIIILNSGKLLDYRKILLPPLDDEKFKGKDMTLEQIYKIKIYTIVNTLYNFVMENEGSAPGEKPTKLWLSGLGSLAENITGYITDGLGIKSALLHTFDTPDKNSSAFCALAGVSSVSKSEQIINLIPEDILDKRSRLLRNSILAAGLSFYVILLAGGYAVLNHLENDLKRINERIKSEQMMRTVQQKPIDVYSSGKDVFAKIVSDNTVLYRAFRDAANLITKDITFNSIQFEKALNKNILKISATIKYSDENIKNALLSKFINSLDTSSSLKRISVPDVSISHANSKQKEVLIKATYEVVQ